MSRTTFAVAAALLVACAASPASAQNFLFNSAETIDKHNFKLAGFPAIILGENGAPDSKGVVTRFGYGFTPSFDIEAKVDLFEDYKAYGADAEYWLVKGGRPDISLSAGFRKVNADSGIDRTVFDVAAIASGKIAHNLDLYGGLDFSFESLDNVSDSSFTRAYVVPGLEYTLHPNVDLLAEFGVGLNDNSPNYFGLGVAFYLR